MDKKYIDAKQFWNRLISVSENDWVGFDTIDEVLSEMSAADVVEVVRCADCKYQEKGENECEAWNLCGYRPWLYIPTEDDAFCSHGERKDG